MASTNVKEYKVSGALLRASDVAEIVSQYIGSYVDVHSIEFVEALPGKVTCLYVSMVGAEISLTVVCAENDFGWMLRVFSNN